MEMSENDEGGEGEALGRYQNLELNFHEKYICDGYIDYISSKAYNVQYNLNSNGRVYTLNSERIRRDA